MFLFKCAILGLFFIYFHLFQTNIAIFTANICEKCLSSLRCWDSNSQPLEHQSPPITTRPGLPPFQIFVNFSLHRKQQILIHCSRYQWDVADFSYYLSIQRICRFVGLFLLLPFLSKILKFSDALIASVGTILTIVAYVLMATGTEDWLGPNGDWPKGWIMYLSAVFQLNSIITVAIR